MRQLAVRQVAARWVLGVFKQVVRGSGTKFSLHIGGGSLRGYGILRDRWQVRDS